MLARATLDLEPAKRAASTRHAIPLNGAISPHDTLESILEPLDRLLLIDTVASTDLTPGTSSFCYSLAGSCPVEY